MTPAPQRIGSGKCALRLLLTVGMMTSMTLAATLTGLVFDSSRAAASGVTLLIVSKGEKVRRSVLTGPDGTFSLELPPGEYQIFSAAGRRLAWFVLEEREKRLKLALNAPEGAVDGDGEGGFPPRVEGNLPAGDDGSGAVDSFEFAPALEAIGNYRVLSGPFDRRTEGNAVAQVINPFLARKPRRFHGSVYEYHRNDFFDARNFFDPVGEPLPEFKRNQFGFLFGTDFGSKLNVLAGYDGLRIVQGSTLLSHVPSEAMKRGDFGELDQVLVDPFTGEPLPGNQIPGGQIHPVSQNLLPALPDPNQPDPDRNHVNNQPVITDHDRLSFTVDYELSEDSKIFARYFRLDRRHVQVHPLPTFGMSREVVNQNGRVAFNHRFSSQLSTQFELGFVRDDFSGLSKNSGQAGLLESLGIDGVSTLDAADEGYPDFLLSGYTDFGDGESPLTSVFNRLVLEADVDYVLNNHSLRFGAEVRATQINNDRTGGKRRGRFVFSGFYTGDAFADFLYGLPDTAERGVGSNRADFRGRQWEFFVRDEWKLNPRYTLSAGLRYEYFRPFWSVHDNVASFHPLLFEPPTSGEILIAGSDRARELGFDQPGTLVFPDRNNWAPSLGVAFSPRGNNRLVIRASYNMYHASPDIGRFIRFLGRNYPFFQYQTAQSSVEQPEIDLSNPFETLTPAELNILGIEPELDTAYVQNWTLRLQKRLFRNWNFEASYEGRKGTGLLRAITGNVPLPGPGSIQERRPNPEYGRFSMLTGSGSQSEHSLDVNVEKQLSDGFSLRADFRWDRVLTDVFWGSPSNPRDLASERALAPWIPAKRLYINYIFDLPFGDEHVSSGVLNRLLSGWRLSGITRIQDGRPFSVSMAGDVNNDGVSGDRPDRTGPGSLPSAQRSIDAWFETQDFAEPEAFAFGDAGRNILLSPPYHDWDVSLSKRTHLADGHLLEFRVECFNAFNQVNFETPESTYGTSVFGKIFGASRAREIELALKYSF